MSIREVLARIARHEDLSTAQMQEVMRQIMAGECTPAQIGALLMGLHMKGECIGEIFGAAQVMRELAVQVPVAMPGLIDTSGTGGDGANLFNVSTAAALVVAAAGGKVAKHGNRSVSGNSGSADVLEAAGVYLDLTPEQIERCIDSVGLGFMYAPAHHGATGSAFVLRRELGIRTLFNLLGPLTNPASVKHQVVGVFSEHLCRLVAEVLERLGSTHVLVIHAEDGLDEISLAAPTFVAELKDGQFREYRLQPEDVGVSRASLSGLSVADAQSSLALIRDALTRRSSEAGARAADMIALNAGAALYAADQASTLAAGVELARDALYTGLAWEKLQELAAFTAVCRMENQA